MKIIKKKNKKKQIPKSYHAAITIRKYDEVLPVFVPSVSKKCTKADFLRDINNGTKDTLVLFNDDLNKKTFQSIFWMDSFDEADDAFYAIHKVLDFTHDNIADLMDQVPESQPVCPHCQAENHQAHGHGDHDGHNHSEVNQVEEIKKLN